MTAFADLHRGNRVRIYDASGEELLPPTFLLMEDARPCEGGRCCEAWAHIPGRREPYKLHSRRDAEVVLEPRQTPAPELATPTGDVLAAADPEDAMSAYLAAEQPAPTYRGGPRLDPQTEYEFDREKLT